MIEQLTDLGRRLRRRKARGQDADRSAEAQNW